MVHPTVSCWFNLAHKNQSTDNRENVETKDHFNHFVTIPVYEMGRLITIAEALASMLSGHVSTKSSKSLSMCLIFESSVDKCE